MPTETVLAALRTLCQVLRELELPHALVGGLALSFWKHPRFTKDVDVLVAVGATRLAELLERLAAAGFRPKRADPFVRLAEAQFLQMLYEPTDAFLEVQVDLLLVSTEYQRQALRRRVPVAAAELGFEVDVIACEDLILHKLHAGRMIDLADAAAILRANRASIDFDYLGFWIRNAQLDADFDRVWNDTFPGEPVLGD